MKDWYLMTNNNRPHMLGGYENDSFHNYKDDSFNEVLEMQDFADTVIVYNYDLSKSKTIRCIIQDNVSNTMLNSMQRCILCNVGEIKAGNYIFFEDRYWLVTGYPGNNNNYYEKATLALCQYKIKWQDADRKVHQRWVNLSTASKYGTGEYNNNTLIVTENNMTMLAPYDDNTLDLDMVRMFIDTHKTNPTRVYRVNRNDDPLYDYGSHGAILSFVLDRVEFNKDTDNQELRICDFKKPNIIKSKPPVVGKLNGNTNLKIGSYRTYTIIFESKEGCVISDPSIDQPIFDFGASGLTTDDVTMTPLFDGCKIKINCKKDINLIGKEFFICVNSLGEEVFREKIRIIDIV